MCVSLPLPPPAHRFPKHFAMGTVVEGAADFYGGRLEAKQRRKRTLTDQLLADGDLHQVGAGHFWSLILGGKPCNCVCMLASKWASGVRFVGCQKAEMCQRTGSVLNMGVFLVALDLMTAVASCCGFLMFDTS